MGLQEQGKPQLHAICSPMCASSTSKRVELLKEASSYQSMHHKIAKEASPACDAQNPGG